MRRVIVGANTQAESLRGTNPDSAVPVDAMSEDETVGSERSLSLRLIGLRRKWVCRKRSSRSKSLNRSNPTPDQVWGRLSVHPRQACVPTVISSHQARNLFFACSWKCKISRSVRDDKYGPSVHCEIVWLAGKEKEGLNAKKSAGFYPGAHFGPMK
jgi:hypothetical protein